MVVARVVVTSGGCGDLAIGCWLLAVGCGRHIGATGIVKSQSGGDESVEAEAEAIEALFGGRQAAAAVVCGAARRPRVS